MVGNSFRPRTDDTFAEACGRLRGGGPGSPFRTLDGADEVGQDGQPDRSETLVWEAAGSMTAVLGWALVAAGVLQVGVGLRMWTGRYYDDNPRLARVMLYGGAPWTMPIPMAGFGVALAGIGALIVLPRQLTLFAVAVAVGG